MEIDLIDSEKHMRWEYTLVVVQPGVVGDFRFFDEVLQDGWEPYAVTWNGYNHVHHLRRTKEL